MGSHINADGQFQSDKYPTCPPGKVPLSVNDKTAQSLLWEYAQRRRVVDAEFSDDLEAALKAAGYEPPTGEEADDDFQCEGCGKSIRAGDKYTTTMDGCYLCEEHAPSFQDCADHWADRDPATLDEDEREAYDAAPGILADHIAAGGSPDDKPLTVME